LEVDSSSFLSWGIMRDKQLADFGKAIRELRKEKGLSQEAFADLAGIDRSYMGHIERGEKNITLTKIYQISGALGLAVSEVFSRIK
jgi:transcriptional regulator with XRE-family HTH domain